MTHHFLHLTPLLLFLFFLLLLSCKVDEQQHMFIFQIRVTIPLDMHKVALEAHTRSYESVTTRSARKRDERLGQVVVSVKHMINYD